MTNQEILKKYKVRIREVDGNEGLSVGGKLTKADTEYIKANKDSIISDIKAEISAKEAKKQAEIDEKIKSGEAKLCVVFSGSYFLDCDVAYVIKADEEHQKMYTDEYRGKIHFLLKDVNEIKKARKLAEEMTKGRNELGHYGSGESRIYEISKDEMRQLVNEEDGMIEKEAEKERDEEAEASSKIAEAKEIAASTGEPQMIMKYVDECDDPHEECSLDIVAVFVMPDGTEKIERQHTW